MSQEIERIRSEIKKLLPRTSAGYITAKYKKIWNRLNNLKYTEDELRLFKRQLELMVGEDVRKENESWE